MSIWMSRGELGPVYGYQWRSWPKADGGHIDQSARCGRLETESEFPPHHCFGLECRRSGSDGAGSLPCVFQFYVADGKLSCQLYQRSCDVFLGLPFNIASYALLNPHAGATM